MDCIIVNITVSDSKSFDPNSTTENDKFYFEIFKYIQHISIHRNGKLIRLPFTISEIPMANAQIFISHKIECQTINAISAVESHFLKIYPYDSIFGRIIL